MEIALIENVQRADLNPIEEAKAYQMLIQEFGLRQEDVAEREAKNRVHAYRLAQDRRPMDVSASRRGGWHRGGERRPGKLAGQLHAERLR